MAPKYSVLGTLHLNHVNGVPSVHNYFIASKETMLNAILVLVLLLPAVAVSLRHDQWELQGRGHDKQYETSAIAYNIPPVELETLEDLYSSTGGENWHWNGQQAGVPWNFSGIANPCADNWQGISCSPNISTSNVVHVVRLKLPVHHLRGELPASIGNLTELMELDLSANMLNGTIPGSIGNLRQLQLFNMSENFWSGSIPETIGYLQDLRMLDLSGVVLNAEKLKVIIQTDPEHVADGLSGTIPASIANLTQLRYFSVGYNAIQGDLTPLGYLHRLEVMFLYLNRFTGSFPESFNNLKSLIAFNCGSNYFTGHNVFDILQNNLAISRFIIGVNQFTGTIPTVLGQRLQLTTIDLSYNQLHGAVPLNVENLTHLMLFNVANNSLSGIIPEYWGNMPNLTYLDLGQNAFHGSLPDCLSSLQKLQFLDVGSNLLTGTIADGIGNLTNIVHFNLGSNKLRGTLPASLGQLSKAYVFDLDNNFFTGSIPQSYEQLHNVEFLNFSDNSLTGAIPDGLMQLPILATLDLSDNYLTGTIPAIHNLNNGASSTSRLQVLYLQNNRLQGHIPTSLANASRLQTILLQNNRLSGPLSNVFNATNQRVLSLVQISQNQLTGEMPEELFFLPQLTTLVAVENCFSGALPECVCDCKTLVTLALNGLQSASTCHNKIFYRISDSYITYRSLKNGIPECLYELPLLHSLHLSGNGLTGTLPKDVTISPSLKSLSLSNNVLTGTIPEQFQERAWDLLDLSFNHISGELKSTFAPVSPNASVSLETNRLSGVLPSAIIHAADVTVLKGNLFDCDLHKKQLPSADPYKVDFVCGSSAFDAPYYLWLAIIVVILSISFAMWRRWEYLDRKYNLAALAAQLREYYDFPMRYGKEQNRDDINNARDMSMSGNSMRATTVAAALEAGRASEASGVSNKSQTTNTSCSTSPLGLKDRLRSVRFICNILDIICKNTLYCTAFIIVVLVIYYPITNPYYRTHLHSYAYAVSAAYTAGKLPFAMEMALFVLFLGVVLVVFYTRLRSYEEHMSKRDRANGLIVIPHAAYFSKESLRKVPIYGAYFGTNLIVVIGVNIAFVYISLYESYTVLIISQILLSMFKLVWNYFLSYFAIVFFAEKNLTGAEQQTNVSKVFYMQLFVLLMNNIAIPFFVVAAISPGCFYNVFVQAPSSTSKYLYQQCTGIILDTGCNIYVDTVATVSYRPPYSYSYQCSSSILKNYAPAFVYMCLAASFAVPAAQFWVMRLQSHNCERTNTRWFNRLTQYPVLHPKVENTSDGDGEDESSDKSAQSKVEVLNEHQLRKRVYFNANQVLLSQLTFLGMLMTFGVVFPPLAVAFAFTICITSVFARLRLGHFLSRCVELNQYAYVDKINIECTRVVSLGMLRNAIWMLVIFSGCFYALFLFDTLGDVTDFERSYWVLIVMPLLPVFAYLLFTAVVKYQLLHQGKESMSNGKETESDKNEDALGGIVMSPLASPQTSHTQTFEDNSLEL